MDEGMTNCTTVPPVWDINQLLKEWKLENILPHLRAEKIDAEILEMIKIPHIRMLLGNFPLGVQIRFEHNLEQWRYNIGKPLHVHKCCQHGSDFVCQQTNDKVLPRTQPKNTITCISSPPQSQQQIKVLHIDTMTTNVATPQQSPAAATINEPNLPLASSSGSPTCSTRSKTSAPFKEIPNLTLPCRPHAPVPQVDLLEILMKSKPEGPHFLKIYGVRKSFLKPERKRLLNVIASYYLRNELRFDLQTSYALEAAILKMFPNERLEMYRRSKRGSLYCKYMNAKKVFFNNKQINQNRDCYFPDENEETNESGEMMEAVECCEPKVENTATLENEDVNIDDAAEFIIEPKQEVDSDYEVYT